MSDDVRDPLIAELLREDEQQTRQGTGEIILPDDPSVPEPYRGKPLSAALADVARIQTERDELAKAVETLKEAQSTATPSQPPPQPSEPNYEVIVNELAMQKVNQRLADNPALQPFAKEAVAMLMTLPASSRITDTTIDSVITYIRGHHFDEIVGKLQPSPPVASDVQAGVPKEAPEPAVKLTANQLANLRAYYGDNTEALKNFINSLKGGM